MKGSYTIENHQLTAAGTSELSAGQASNLTGPRISSPPLPHSPYSLYSLGAVPYPCESDKLLTSEPYIASLQSEFQFWGDNYTAPSPLGRSLLLFLSTFSEYFTRWNHSVRPFWPPTLRLTETEEHLRVDEHPLITRHW